MKIEFLSTLAVIAPDPPANRKLYVDALGLPLGPIASDARHGRFRPTGEATSPAAAPGRGRPCAGPSRGAWRCN
jgi:hypothetical protein